MREERNEWLLVFYLSTGHKLLGVEAITQDCPTRVEWDFRHLLRRALLIRADAMIIAHNHPSGDVTASRSDMITTAQFARVCQELGIPLLAHYIVTENETGLCGYW
ncbi:JAB domain-containing protein [Sphingomonas rhizophila]|uniref:JAB domain-containing protein n=1 Tax=Sphingomonas rhizophila TaxID=2071607 RepID=UPI003CCD7EE6